MKIFEVTLAGFDGATDETDDLIKWIMAGNIEQVQALYPKGTPIKEMDPPLQNLSEEGIDGVLGSVPSVTYAPYKTDRAHTPGPWHIGMKPGPMIYGPQGEQVADLSARLIPDGETSANASLIQSAPELLEALEKLLGRYTFQEQDETEARAAIAKATGGTSHERN